MTTDVDGDVERAPDTGRNDETGPRGEAPQAEAPQAELPRIRVIWNPDAGRKAGIPLHDVDEARMRAVLARGRLGRELVTATSATEIRTLAADAVSRGYALVVAAGGDGTVGLVAEELLGSDTVLGILPVGSVMNIGRSLGLPGDLDAEAEAIATGEVRRIDVGEARGHPFFEAASVGLNVPIFAAAERFDQGDWRSTIQLLGLAFRLRPARIQIDLDADRIETRALMVVVANAPFVGAGMTVAPAARLDDGRFDVRVFRHLSKLRLLAHLASISFGRAGTGVEVETYRSRFVRIDAPRPMPARADSRDLGETPIELTVRPAALSVVAPGGRG